MSAQLVAISMMIDGGLQTLNALRVLIYLLEHGPAKISEIRDMTKSKGDPHDLVMKMCKLGFLEVADFVQRPGGGRGAHLYGLTDAGRKVAEVFCKKRSAV